MSIYDDIDADVLQNYQEYSLANIIYYSLKESTTSEQSARMTAMDNASKNACKCAMVTALTLAGSLGTGPAPGSTGGSSQCFSAECLPRSSFKNANQVFCASENISYFIGSRLVRM